MSVTDEQIAEIRGEALAGRLLATMAIGLFLSKDKPNAKAVLDFLSGHADDVLNISLPATGDADLNERVREVARARLNDDLASIRSGLA